MKRRNFLRRSLITVASLSIANKLFADHHEKHDQSHSLPKLPYGYDALEPHIDARTMEIHHSKHHQGYVNKLNKALDGLDAAELSIEDLMRQVHEVKKDRRRAIINSGGGHVNHSLFWQNMSPKGGGTPKGDLAKAIERDLASYENFREKFDRAATKRFGSGWGWLVVNGEGKLEIYSTANQNSPYMEGHTPILGIDVWEHAYYLKYQNRRSEYVKNFHNVINWARVTELYLEAVK